MTKPRIAISWQAGEPPPDLGEVRLRAALAGFLKALGFSRSGVNLLVADDAALRGLNARHRGLERPTDVLSWSYREDGEAPELLGELAISLQRARAQAEANGWDLATELLRLLAHGCAHLAGHDHGTAAEERAMRAVEIELLAGAGLGRDIYPEVRGRRPLRAGPGGKRR